VGLGQTWIFLYNDDVFSDEDFLSSAVTEREQHRLDGNTDLQIEVVESTSVVSEIQAQQSEDEQATTSAVSQKGARKESGLKQPASSTRKHQAKTEANHSLFYCIYCRELFIEPPMETWVQCSGCMQWCHESCAPIEPNDKHFMCDYCAH